MSLAVLTLVAALVTHPLTAPASGGPPGSARGDTPADLRGTGAWPVGPPATVTHGFAPPATAYGAGHRGVDLAGSPGTVVRAALPGKVVFAGNLAGRGVVTVSHGETRTTYEPVTPTVAVGTQVGRGRPLGLLQTAASHCSPAACLHWGWLLGETYLDPLDLIGARPVRLWPWDGSAAAR